MGTIQINCQKKLFSLRRSKYKSKEIREKKLEGRKKEKLPKIEIYKEASDDVMIGSFFLFFVSLYSVPFSGWGCIDKICSVVLLLFSINDTKMYFLCIHLIMLLLKYKGSFIQPQLELSQNETVLYAFY